MVKQFEFSMVQRKSNTSKRMVFPMNICLRGGVTPVGFSTSYIFLHISILYIVFNKIIQVLLGGGDNLFMSDQ